MNYKRVFHVWVSIVGVIVAFIIVATVVIDPINAIGFPLIKGINNNKYAQDQYMDVYKPFELARKEADVILIGTSRVYRGIRPTFEGVMNEKVYNLGMSSLSLDHMKAYLQFAYKIHQPKKVFIGLDLFNFSRTNFKNRKVGFSQDRLDNINRNFSIYHAIIESLQLNKSLLKNTFVKSHKNRCASLLFSNGWYIRDDDAPEIVPEGYYYNLNDYKNVYKEFKYSEEAITCLEHIVNEAKERGIEVFVFFNPINADIRNIVYLSGHGESLADIKKQIVRRIGRVYDFNFNNAYTESRKLYYDCSHYSPKMGEYIKADILVGHETERMHILTSDNIDRQLEKDYTRYQDWVSKNKEYVNLMTEKIKSNGKIEEGEFKDILGF